MKPPTIVGFDSAERTVTLQFAEDIRDRDFAIGAQFGCARNQNSTQFCHEAEEKAHLLAKAREELEAVRAVLLAAHVTNRGTLAEMAADLVETATSYRNAVMAAREEIARLNQRILDDNKAYGCELRDPAGTIWDHAAKLQQEVVRLRKVLVNAEELERYSAGDGHRQWARCGAWLRPDDVVVIISATAIDAAKGGAK